MRADSFGRVLVFVAHPDDETIGCSGLLQRATESLVVFAVDGAPPYYGFERKYASLRKYSEARFLEASRVLKQVPNCTFRRLTRRKGAHFVDQHLFQDLQQAFTSLSQIIHEFSPELIITHAYEGGHIDHDASHVLATRAARALHIMNLEFPLYWRTEDGRDVFQEFRESQNGEFVLTLSENEIAVKQRMVAEYRTQRELTSVFHHETERFRPVIKESYTERKWADYAFENRRRRLKADSFLGKVNEFEEWASMPESSERRSAWIGRRSGFW